jgi:hypothetical protein
MHLPGTIEEGWEGGYIRRVEFSDGIQKIELAAVLPSTGFRTRLHDKCRTPQEHAKNPNYPETHPNRRLNSRTPNS